jgi:hypothetical protein
MGKDCGCSKSESKTVSCEAIVEGTFTKKNGVQFTATMSATGAGTTCEGAKESAKKNAIKTLEHFLKENPRIVDYTYQITTNCGEKCDKKKYTLEAQLPGEFEYTLQAGMVSYKAKVYTDDTKTAQFLAITGAVMPDGLLGGGLVQTHTTSTTIYDKSIKATLQAEGAAEQTINLALAAGQINNTAKAGYAVAAQVVGNYQTGMAGGKIKSTGSISLPTRIAFDVVPLIGDSYWSSQLYSNEIKYNVTFDFSTSDSIKKEINKGSFIILLELVKGDISFIATT